MGRSEVHTCGIALSHAWACAHETARGMKPSSNITVPWFL